MDKDFAAEIHPLKNSDGKSQGNDETRPEKEAGNKNQNGLFRLSRWRTAAFFTSLFLCLTIVFAFSFIIPCPVRPYSQRTWITQYNSAVTYVFLTTEDVNQDKVQDVLLLLKVANGSNFFNASCEDEGFESPCSFLTALSGTNGSALWTRPVAEDVQLLECGINKLGGIKSSGCIVIGKPDSITAMDSQTGNTLWQKNTGFAGNYTITKPLLKISDVDGDDIQDLMVVVTVEDELQSFIFSGRNGDHIGQNRNLGIDRKAGHYMHITKSGSQYVLFYTGNSIEGYSLADLYAKIVGTESKPGTFKQDPNWEGKANRTVGYVPILPVSSSGDVLYLINVPGKKYNNLLVVKSEVSELLDGQSLISLWSIKTINILSKPALGYYKKEVLSIMMELGIGNNRKKVIIIDSSSGAVQWELEMNFSSDNPNPVTLHTGDHRSAFLFWGEYTVDLNSTMTPNPNLYIFHPSRPKVLLQLKNNTQNIVLFDAVLFERSRHACYVLLTGPITTENPGTVSVSKRKLKEDITNSKVIWLGQEDADNNQEIREHFFRMRYSSNS